MGWKAFSVDAPELAETGRALLEQFGPGLAFLATVRADGAPRLHPVCPVLSAERLFVLITAASPKRRDLERDGRYALQTFPQPKPGSDEFYIAGTATVVEDARDPGEDLYRRETPPGAVGDRLRALPRTGHAHALGASAHAGDAPRASDVARFRFRLMR